MILDGRELSKEIKESYRINGISHLFSVSGMHINFFVSIIYLYLNKITYNKRIKYLITNIFIITYLILFPSSSLLRSAVMSILYSINYLLKLSGEKILRKIINLLKILFLVLLNLLDIDLLLMILYFN